MIYQYNEYDHPAGFVGLRVSVSVNGKVKQKYFTFHKRPGEFVSLAREKIIIKKADKLNDKWTKQQAKARLINRKNAISSGSKNTTRVRGISLIASFDKKKVDGVEKNYPYVAFSIHVSHEGENFATTIRLQKDGSNLRSAWKKAVDFVCEKKELKNNNEFYKRTPTREEFFKVCRSIADGAATKK